MEITIEGQPVRTWDELKVGEHGFIPTFDAHPSDVRPGLLVWPSVLRFQRDNRTSCYRVTKTADGANLEFVPFVDTEQETCIASESFAEFKGLLSGSSALGWRINGASVRIVYAGGDEWRFFATMYRDGDS